MKLSDSIIFNINQLSKASNKEVYHRLSEYNIHHGQPPVMFTLHFQDGLTLSELANKLDITKATLSKILQRMEKNDLIKRIPNQTDKRNIHLHLTKKSKHILNEVSEIYQELEDYMIKVLNDDEQKQLIHLLKKVNQHMGGKE